MRLASFLVFAAAVAPVAAFWACSTGDSAQPAVTGRIDAAPTDDAAESDVHGPDQNLPSQCSITDIPQGTGTKFCDLPGDDAAEVTVPAGFCVREFTTLATGPVKEARVMRFAPNGDLFVAAPGSSTVGGASGGRGVINVLPDDDGDGRADQILDYTTATTTNGATCFSFVDSPRGTACVHGLLFASDYLYYTRADEVVRLPYKKGDRKAPDQDPELVAKLGGNGVSDIRWTHTLELTKEGSILVSRGRMDSDTCSQEEMEKGQIEIIHAERGGALPYKAETYADGFRNPMYVRCSPSSCGDCYASELSGDNWESVGGREKLALLTQDSHWGFPCCVTGDTPNAQAVADAGAKTCAAVSNELVSITLHDTNFGFDFDRGGFPGEYKHGIFVALHGVFTSFGGTGVIFLPTSPATLRPTGSAKPFLHGLTKDGSPSGRASDVAFAPDGRLFVCDDTAGKIYWVAPKTLAKP